MFYSKSTNGFYVAEIHGKNMPEDVVEITEEQHTALLDAQAEGKTIQPDIHGAPEAVTLPHPPAPVPRVVTMRQARLALLAAGKYSAVNAAMADASEAIRIEWEFAATVDRDSQTTQLLAAALNLNDTKLDELFTAAGKL
jgi:hypothetical protein